MRFVLFIFLCCCAINMHAVQKTQNEYGLSIDQAQMQLLNSKSHLDLLNYIIVKHNFNSYLEIGVADGVVLRKVVAPHKVGVDPVPWASIAYSTVADSFFPTTSDEFFKNNQEYFDLIFIDGLHLHEQVLKDVENSMKWLNPGGIIVMHDCLPFIPEHQIRIPPPGQSWNGDVWKAAAYIRMHLPNVHFCVLNMDCGCGILTPNSTQFLFPSIPIELM